MKGLNRGKSTPIFLRFEICIPILSRCADPSLCFPDATGQLFVNPSARLALRAECSVEDNSNCKADMVYRWNLKDTNGTVKGCKSAQIVKSNQCFSSIFQDLTDTELEAYFANGNDNQEVAVAKSFFMHPTGNTLMDKFTIGLDTTNGDGVNSLNMIFMKINKSPTGGLCNVEPPEGTAIITEFELICQDWNDPEEIGIKHYTIASKWIENSIFK